MLPKTNGICLVIKTVSLPKMTIRNIEITAIFNLKTIQITYLLKMEIKIGSHVPTEWAEPRPQNEISPNPGTCGVTLFRNMVFADATCLR